jgi:hypothetical protein
MTLISLFLSLAFRLQKYPSKRNRPLKKDSAMEAKKNVIDRRQIHLEKVMRPDYIPFLGGRPKRTAIINNDDIINLAIMLNTTDSVEMFFKNL